MAGSRASGWCVSRTRRLDADPPAAPRSCVGDMTSPRRRTWSTPTSEAAEHRVVLAAAVTAVVAVVYVSVLEAVQKVQKYAHASRATVRLREEESALRFEVADDGDGCDVAATGKPTWPTAVLLQPRTPPFDARQTPVQQTTNARTSRRGRASKRVRYTGACPMSCATLGQSVARYQSAISSLVAIHTPSLSRMCSNA